jgi:hypothetical protein
MTPQIKPATPAEAPKEVPKDAAKNEFAEAVKLAVAVGISEGLKAAMPAPAPRPEAPDTSQCRECFQRRSACKGEHKRIEVFCSRYPEHQEWFFGARINGITYKSSFPGQLITVPAESESDILRTVRNFEDGERKREMGGKHDGQWKPDFARTQINHDPNYR